MIPPLLPFYLVIVTIGLSLACLITLFTPQLSQWIPALTTYGKASILVSDKPLFLRAISVPKRWFAHFYIIAVINAASWLFLACLLGIRLILPIPSLVYLLNLLTPAVPTVSWSTAVLALSLMFIHVFRRCYESLFVSVYSNSSMNVGHYIMGMVHYLILPLTVVCEAHGFMDQQIEPISLFSISLRQWIGVVAFLYCNIQQYICAQKMAKVRKTPDGLASHYNHGIFYGGWFNLVSCPHFLFEVGIYIALWFVIWNSVAYGYMLVFVVINQTFAAQINHKWYHKTFPKYPKDRYAIFPYLL